MTNQESPREESNGHTPVLVEEILSGLAVHPGATFVDGTVGLGGHAEAILHASVPDGKLLGIDADPDAVRLSRQRLRRFGERAIVTQGNFRDLAQIARSRGFTTPDGVLLDLGISSYQLDGSDRGFSFRRDAPLDMRMDPAQGPPAADLVNGLQESELARLLYEYGEEHQAKRIARAIVRNRPILTTHELSAVVSQVTGRSGQRIHPATKTFQALRIAVNGELANLEAGLAASVDLLPPGGRIAVVSFHSLEDRRVKRFFQEQSRDCVCPPDLPVCACSHRAMLRPVRTGAILPSAAEVEANPRSRSARLRLAERI